MNKICNYTGKECEHAETCDFNDHCTLKTTNSLMNGRKEMNSASDVLSWQFNRNNYYTTEFKTKCLNENNWIVDDALTAMEQYAATQAIEFAKWIDVRYYKTCKWDGIPLDAGIWRDTDGDEFTTEQLYEIFKEQGI